MDEQKVDPTLVTVAFGISIKVPFSRCRACNQKVMWYNVQLDERTNLPFLYSLQNPGEQEAAYCPYCGKRKLYAEDGMCHLKRKERTG